MKTAIITLLAFTMMTAFTGDKKFPAASVKTLDGKTVNVQDYIGKGNPVIVSFWASWCSPCKRELDAMTEIFPEWKENYKVELLAITIDDSRGLAKVPGIVTSKSWPFTVLADTKQELQQSLGFQTVPETFLLDGAGNIVYTHSGYNAGDEFELEEKLKELK
ncbi:MAG TPA: TlpA disulfide reductase family protein [Saprospiraceae bacterium]|nr:TlpA disulfide reductase family protein [Saprospiraceae bacterium]